MTSISEFDTRWSELFGMALFWSGKSYEALTFKQYRDSHVSDLSTAPASELCLIRQESDNLISAVAGCRVACECVMVDFMMIDPDHAKQCDGWQLHRHLLAEVVSYAEEQKVSYIRMSMFDLEEHQTLLAEMSTFASKHSRITNSEVSQIQFLFLPESLQKFCEHGSLTCPIAN